MAPNQKPLRIGVLYEEVQMADLVGLDVLGGLSTKAVDMICEIQPAVNNLRPFSTPMEFLYISSSLEAPWSTSDMHVQPTHTYINAPRDLDIIMIGGPNPATVKEESLQFLREASKQTKFILTTCTGGLWLARSGVLDGKKATTNRGFLDVAKSICPNVEWQDQRWVIENGHFEGAQIWTAGGAGCGIDMTIEYVRENFNENLVEICCLALDFPFDGRSQFYSGPIPNLFDPKRFESTTAA